MNIFITGTDTNVGKTVVSSWLCLHTGADYFKPIQTGAREGRDTDWVRSYSGARVHPEAYCYQAPVSPHLAAAAEQDVIDITTIQCPMVPRLMIEGAGGVFVPLSKQTLMIDLIQQFHVPTLVVAASRLGMINHTLLTLAALRARQIPVLGVIVTGMPNQDACEAIETYGETGVLAQLPFLPTLNQAALQQVPLGADLSKLMGML
jgi:dethiobiotin synthetase